MKPGIDPTVDYSFNRLFGVARTRDLLISLIEAVLEPPPDQRILQLDLINPFNHKESSSDKLSVLDIKARDHSGRQLNVEMQMLSHSFCSARIFYYWAKFHQQQFQEGDPYDGLRPTVCICFLKGTMFPQVADHRLQFELRERHHGVLFSGHIGVILVQLGKFARTRDDLATPLDRWGWFLKHGAELDSETLPETLGTPEIRKAMEELTMFSLTELERDQYEARLKWIRDEEARKKDALAEGRAEGREEGLLVGRIQFLQSLLTEPVTPASDLFQLGLASLSTMTDELERRFRATTADDRVETE